MTEKYDRSIICSMEIDHLTVPVSDYEQSKRFYADVLEPLGFAILLDWYDKRRAYLGVPPETSSLWLVESDLTGTLEIALAAPTPTPWTRFTPPQPPRARGRCTAGHPTRVQQPLLRGARTRPRRQLARGRPPHRRN